MRSPSSTQWTPNKKSSQLLFLLSFHARGFVLVGNNNNNNNYTRLPVFQAGKHTHVLPDCHRNSRHMGWHGYWASPGDWQRHHSHHPGHQGKSLSVSTPVPSAAAGECGLLPRHNELQMRSRCSRCLKNCLFFTPAALRWSAQRNNNKKLSCRWQTARLICTNAMTWLT